MHLRTKINYDFLQIWFLYTTSESKSGWFGGLVYGVECLFQQYFSYIVAVSFIGGGNRSILTLNSQFECQSDQYLMF